MLLRVREKFVAGAAPNLPDTSGPSDGVWDTGVNMLGRSGVWRAVRVDEVRGCREFSLSHSRRDNREAVAMSKWLSEQRPKSVNEIFLDISGRTVCHSTCRRNHDCH